MSFGGGKADPGTESWRDDQSGVSRVTQEKLFDISDQLADVGNQFFEQEVRPVLAQVGDTVDAGIANFDTLRKTATDMAATRNQLFETEGMDGIKKFFDYVNTFDRDEYAAQRERAGFGDVERGLQTAEASQSREMAARGINPNSMASFDLSARNRLAASLQKANISQMVANAADEREAQLVQAGGSLGMQTSGLAAPYLGQAAELARQGINAAGVKFDAARMVQGVSTAPLMDAARVIQPIYSGSTQQAGQAVRDVAEQKKQDAAGKGALVGKAVGIGLGIATGNPLPAIKGLMG